MIKNILAGVALAALVLAGDARSGVIGNGPPNQTNGSDLNAFLEADNFTVASATNILQIKYWTLQTDASDYSGTTDWGFYTDSTGAPGTSVATGNSVATGAATGNSALGLSEFAYSFAVSVPLGAGDYWLVLHNGPSGTLPQTSYYWAWSADSGDSQSVDLLGDPGWFSNEAELAFELTTGASTVPEPAAATLLATGLLGAWLVSRRRNGKA